MVFLLTLLVIAAPYAAGGLSGPSGSRQAYVNLILLDCLALSGVVAVIVRLLA
jgi:hypothetical protein